MTEPSTPPAPASRELVARLLAARQAMLRIHKVMLDAEKVGYEQVKGPIQNNGELLQLVISDPWFAWLHPISQMIVAIDEAMEEKTPLSTARVTAFLDRIKTLMYPEPEGTEFQQNYDRVTQNVPEAMELHIKLRALLKDATS